MAACELKFCLKTAVERFAGVLRNVLKFPRQVSLFGYAVTSTLATVVTVAYAYQKHSQFYPIVIFLASSKISVTVTEIFRESGSVRFSPTMLNRRYWVTWRSW
jgi:hypothetical protein